MAAPSIIVNQVEKKPGHTKDRCRAAAQRQFALGMLDVRLPLELKRKRPNDSLLVDQAWNIRFRHPAALRYFRKELAKFLHQIDGTIVVEENHQPVADLQLQKR